MSTRGYSERERAERYGTQQQESLSGLWIAVCRNIIADDKVFIDKDFQDDDDLIAWHFTPNGTLFIEANIEQDIDIVYSYCIENAKLHIVPEYGGNFGFSGVYDFSICNGEAIITRLSNTLNHLWSGSPATVPVEQYRLIRYRGADLDYVSLKESNYRHAIDNGAIPIDREWVERRLLEDEKRYLERLCAERGNYIDETDDED